MTRLTRALQSLLLVLVILPGSVALVILAFGVPILVLNRPSLQSPVAGFFCFVIYLIATAVVSFHGIYIGTHELGHTLAARLVGFRFQFLMVGPILLVREQGKLRIRLTGKRKFSGYTKIIVTGGPPLRSRMVLFLLGGALANLALAVCCLLLAWGLQGISPVSGRRELQFVLICLGVMNLSLGLANLVPYHERGHPSDGAQLWGLFFSKPTVPTARPWQLTTSYVHVFGPPNSPG